MLARQRPAVARPQEPGVRADHRLEQVIALDAALPPDARAEAQLGRQRLEDARARLALAQVLLERRAQPQRDQRRLRVHLDQVLVEREAIGERADQVRGARGQRAGPLAEPLARGDADAARQVDLGRALRVGRDRRLARAARVAIVRRAGGGRPPARASRPPLGRRRPPARDRPGPCSAGRAAGSAARRCTAASRRRRRGWCRAACGS